MMRRRHFVSSAALALAPLAASLTGCRSGADVEGGFLGISQERGHLLRQQRQWPAPAVVRRTRVVIAGGGVAGLAAARAMDQRGMQDYAMLELEDSAGGNARGTLIAGIACPLGAHYLPVPGPDATEILDLLQDFGLCRQVAGRWEFDERHLCHSPQERLFMNGQWQEGLLPVQDASPQTLAAYQKMEQLVAQLQQQYRWPTPASRTPMADGQKALASITFDAWLTQNGLSDPWLHWYLNYCCQDDFGAGTAVVSAWAGIHYFASRQGFDAPGGYGGHNTSVLTWPQGNAWLTQRLAAPLQDRLKPGRVVLRIAEGKHGVEVDAWNVALQQVERWQADRAIVALPVFVAARVSENAPDFLHQARAATSHAPWLVANLHLRQPLQDRSGPAPSWDNVLYGNATTAPGLGYVDAMHQSLQPVPGATVLTYYRALGGPPAAMPQVRQHLLQRTWPQWRDTILAELAQAHPDIGQKLTRMEITRYGHAMAIPTPTLMQSPARQHIANADSASHSPSRIHYAHSDWAGYSVFEEAYCMGLRVGMRVVDQSPVF